MSTVTVEAMESMAVGSSVVVRDAGGNRTWVKQADGRWLGPESVPLETYLFTPLAADGRVRGAPAHTFAVDDWVQANIPDGVVGSIGAGEVMAEVRHAVGRVTTPENSQGDVYVLFPEQGESQYIDPQFLSPTTEPPQAPELAVGQVWRILSGHDSFLIVLDHDAEHPGDEDWWLVGKMEAGVWQGIRARRASRIHERVREYRFVPQAEHPPWYVWVRPVAIGAAQSRNRLVTLQTEMQTYRTAAEELEQVSTRYTRLSDSLGSYLNSSSATTDELVAILAEYGIVPTETRGTVRVRMGVAVEMERTGAVGQCLADTITADEVRSLARVGDWEVLDAEAECPDGHIKQVVL